MSLFSPEEKRFLQEALSVYLQLVQQRISREQAAGYLDLAQSLMDKVEGAEADGTPGASSEKPRGISDEWFENACLTCDKLAPGGRCLDKITEKFPGKCDPILIYERNKAKL